MTTNADPNNSTSELSKTNRVYEELRRRIRELKLLPGSHLRKDEIALELGVSRAPVSEAITRLAEEALVDIFPRHGSFVAPIRSQDVLESFLIRTALEVEVARRVARIVNDELKDRLKKNMEEQIAALEKEDFMLFYELDKEMHTTLFAAIDCPRASRLHDSALAPMDRPRQLHLPEKERIQATLVEHQRIIDAIATGDPEYAAAAMRAHMSMAERSVRLELARIEAEGSTPTPET